MIFSGLSLLTFAVSFVALFVTTKIYQPLTMSGVTLGLSGIFFSGVVVSVYTGEFRYGRPGIWEESESRAARPIGFWFVIIAYSAMAAICAMLGFEGIKTFIAPLH